MNKKNKVYSGYDTLPTGQATMDILPGCLVLEGGGFRGTYTSGVLDCLMQHGFNFQTTIGISAGAMNGLLYTSGDIGRAGRTNLGYRHDSRYVGLKAYRSDKGVIGFKFCFQDLNATLPVNMERLYNQSRRFIAGCTCLETGEITYFETNQCKDIFLAVKASASLPFVSRPVKIENKHYLDGGCSVKIPYQWAIDEGFDKIIVVTTRERGYRKKVKKDHRLNKNSVFYSRYPLFAKSLAGMDKTVNQERETLEQMEKDGKIFLIAPSTSVSVGRLEKDMEKLGALYWQGYHDAEASLAALRNYLQ